MTLIICESLREIGEMACVTSAWSSRGQALNASCGGEEDYSFELRNFELKFFAGPPANEIW